MAHVPEDSEFLSDCEAVRSRPGMYLGDVGKLGVARLIAEAAIMLAGLCVSREKFPYFTFHAHLDVSMSGRDVTVAVEFNPKEAPDIASRCDELVACKHRFTKDEWPLGRGGGKSVSPLPILLALTNGLHVVRHVGGETISVLIEHGGPLPDLPKSGCETLVAVRFFIGDRLDPDGLIQDYLEGFLQGNRIAPGLVLRSVSAV